MLASYEVDTTIYRSGGTNTSAFYLATTSGTGITSNVQMNVPGQLAAVQPVLQRADGSYIGTVSTSAGNSVIAFTGAGTMLWTGPNDTPQIATSDNGVIASPSPGQYVQFDQAGNAIGQLPCANPVVSWTNNVYQMQPVIQVSCAVPASAADDYPVRFQAKRVLQKIAAEGHQSSKDGTAH